MDRMGYQYQMRLWLALQVSDYACFGTGNTRTDFRRFCQRQGEHELQIVAYENLSYILVDICRPPNCTVTRFCANSGDSQSGKRSFRKPVVFAT